MIFVGIIVYILIFSIIVLIHEFGHFKSSRIFGVKVYEFGLGIPPKIKKIFTDKKGTNYTINLLPLGGFVKLKGEDQTNLQELNDNDSLINKPAWQQSIIILSGVFMNFLLAIFIFSILFFIGVKPLGINNKIETSLDLKLLPNYTQSIESGIITKGEGIYFYSTETSVLKESQGIIEKIEISGEIFNINEYLDLKNILDNNIGKEIKIFGYNKNPDYKKGCECIEKFSFEEQIIIPIDGKLGVYIGDNIEHNPDFKYKYGIFKSIKQGTLETYNQSILTFQSIKYLLNKLINPTTKTQRQEALQEISGPIGIVNFITDTMSNGFIFLLLIGAIISVNLGIFNLLPIPALDGGRFFMIWIGKFFELIFRKKFNKNYENFIHVTFFIFLIALSIIIAYNDIVKIINN